MKIRELFESPTTTAVMAFGRMNPPTIGHAKLVDAIKSQAGDPFIFLSQSQKPKTDPLSFEDKLRYAKFFFPNVTIGNPEVKTIIQAVQKIESLGYQQLIYVAGSDRVQAFEELLNKYNGKDFTFKSINVVSAGERDPDADGAEGMSASKMRQAAADNDIESFKQGVPEPKLADEMFAAVRQGMGIAEGKSPHKKGTKKYKKHMAAMHAEDVKENITSADIPVVTYDRNYGGDVNKVLAVKRDAKADAEALYKKLGGVSDANYQIISQAAEQKKQELRQVYRDALAKQGIKGAAALRSPEYLLFRKQNADLQIMLGTAMNMTGNGSGKILKPNGKIIKPSEGIEEAELTPGQGLPKQIKVIKMPTPPQAPTGPDGTGEDGTRIGTTPKGNRSVSSGAGTYIFAPTGDLMLYMTPKIGGLQQTHNIPKQRVTVNYGTTIDGAGIDQKATYDMSGKLISGDNTSISSGNVGVSVDKDKGSTVNYKVDANTKVSANSKTGIKVN
jgi:nicotinic acid mononucleotide adenylyltransferase